MKNRIPTQYVDTPNGKAIRYAVYNESGDFLRFEYLILADEPTEKGTPLSMENLLSPSTAALSLNFTESDGEPTPDKAFKKLSKWYLIQEYTTAGTYTYTIPQGITELGICMVGGGGSGAAIGVETSSATYAVASGGGSGECRSFILDVSNKTQINIVVGAGGKNGNNGGTTSFYWVTATGGSAGQAARGSASSITAHGADGGQPSFVNWGIPKNGIAAGATTQAVQSTPATTNRSAEAGSALNTPAQSVNPFEPDISSPRKFLLSSGGFVDVYVPSSGSGTGTARLADPPNPFLDNIKGGDGTFIASTSSITGENATGYGNGGGAAICTYTWLSSITATPGAGSDGAVFIYAR